MTASRIGYYNVLHWVKGYLFGKHCTVTRTVAWVVLCILVAQRVTPAALARAIPAEQGGSGRSRLRRVRRWWQGPELDLGRLTPLLIRTALTLLPVDQNLIVALDTTRVGRWEVWQAGIVFAGHTLPVAWAVLPYPWPKGHFRQTTLALVEQLQQALAEGPRWVLVADRGFPSADLFAQLFRRQTGWTVRLRLGDWIEVGGVYAKVWEHLEEGRLQPGQRVEASIGRGTAKKPVTKAWVVVNDVVPPLPQHKQNAGTEKERARRAKKKAQDLAYKGPGRSSPSVVAKRYAQTWVLFTTAGSLSAAVTQYAARMAIEQTFRDWHHGWGLRQAAADLPTAAMVGRLMGIVSLAYCLQVELGWRFSQDSLGQQRRAQWTVSNRVSFFWCGQHIFQDPGYDWSAWLAEQWQHLTICQITTRMDEAA